MTQYVVNPVFGAWTKVIPTNCPRSGQNGKIRVQIRCADVRTSEVGVSDLLETILEINETDNDSVRMMSALTDARD